MELIILSLTLTLILIFIAKMIEWNYAITERTHSKYRNRNQWGEFIKKDVSPKTNVPQKSYHYVPVRSGNDVLYYIKSEIPEWMNNRTLIINLPRGAKVK